MNKSESQPLAAGQAAHTPTPWHVVPIDGTNRFMAHKTGIACVGDCFVMSDGEGAKDVIDAAFIVRACNSHAALVAALEKNAEFFRVACFATQYRETCAALAAAKGGAS